MANAQNKARAQIIDMISKMARDIFVEAKGTIPPASCIMAAKGFVEVLEQWQEDARNAPMVNKPLEEIAEEVTPAELIEAN